MIVIFPESPQTLPRVEAKINYSYSEALFFVRLKGCSLQVEVKSRKTKENGISHLRETALIHHTREIFTSKPTFIQGFSEKLLKNGEHKSPPVHGVLA